MSEESKNVTGYKLGIISRAVRVIVAAPVKLATQVTIGVVLGLSDACNNDPASKLLASKLTEGAASAASAVGSVARASGSKAASATSSFKGAIRFGVEHLGSSANQSPKAPALNAAKEFVSEVTSDIKRIWVAAGNAPVQVEQPPVKERELPALTSDGPSTSPSADPTTETQGTTARHIASHAAVVTESKSSIV